MRGFKLLIAISGFLLFFALPQDAAAQRCLPTQVLCDGRCERSAANRGQECEGTGGQVGTFNSCGVCANLECPDERPVTCDGVCSARFANEDEACTTATGSPGEWNECGDCVATGACSSGQISCDGACREPAAPCPSGSNRSYNDCRGCGGCSSGFIDCDGGAGYQCTSAARPETCVAPNVWDACAQSCSAYVQISPSQAQIGFVHVRDDVRVARGNLRLEGTADGQGDIILNSGKAIQVAGATDGIGRLNMGNWEGRQAQTVLHTSGGDQISELVLSHGRGDFDATSRWALSLRGSNNFEIWRNRSGWGDEALFSIDYATGAINIGNALTVEGDVTIAEGQTLTSPSATIGGVEIRDGQVGGVSIENVLTEIEVGDGLTVSGTGSSRTISVGDTVVTRPDECDANELLQWNGTAWECAPPSEGGLAEETDPLHGDWLSTPALSRQLTIALPDTALNEGILLRGAVNPRLRIFDNTNNVEAYLQSTDSWAQIGTASAHPVRLMTGNLARATLTNDGRFGIGTSSPQNLLHVAPTTVGDGVQISGENALLRIIDPTNGVTTFIQSLDNFGRFGTLSNNSFAFYVGGQNNIVAQFDPTGFFGIGTTAPSERLDVAGNIRTTGNLILPTLGATVDGVNLDTVLTGLTGGEGITVTGTGNSRTIAVDATVLTEADNVLTQPSVACAVGESLTWDENALNCIAETDPVHAAWLGDPTLTARLLVNLPNAAPGNGITLSALNDPRISVIDRTNSTILSLFARDSRADILSSGGPLNFTSRTADRTGEMSLDPAGSLTLSTGNLILSTLGATVDGVNLDTVLTAPAVACGEGQALTWNGSALACVGGGEAYTAGRNISIPPNTNIISVADSPTFDGLTVGVIDADATHLRLRANATGLADLLFTQNDADRWALAMRNAAEGRHFQILRTRPDGSWTPALAVDYGTGELRVASGATIAAGFRAEAGATILGAVNIIGGPLNMPNRATAPDGSREGAVYWSNVAGNRGLRVFDGANWDEFITDLTPGDGITISGTGDSRTIAVAGTVLTEADDVLTSASTINWSQIGTATFPAACPPGAFVTAIGGTLTCAAPPVAEVPAESDPLHRDWLEEVETGRRSLGIGTPSPQNRLHVASAVVGDGVQVSGENALLRVIDPTNTVTTFMQSLDNFGRFGTLSNHSFAFYIGGQNNIVAQFDPSGFFGIGTTAPSERVDIAGNLRATGNILLPTAGATVDGVNLDTVLTNLTAGEGITITGTGNSRTIAVDNTVLTEPSATCADGEALTWDGTALACTTAGEVYTGAGNIQISPTNVITTVASPTFNGLTVGALADDENHVRVRTSSTGLADIIFTQGATDRWATALRPESEGRDFQILRTLPTGVWTPALTVDYGTGAVTTTGNLGLGTTTPAERLDIVGNISLTGTINGINIANLATIPPACNDGVRLIRWSDIDGGWRCVSSFSDLTIEGNLTVLNELSVGGPLRLVEDGFLVLNSVTNAREGAAAFQNNLRTVVGAGALFYNSDDDVLRLLTNEGNFVSIIPGAGGTGGGIGGTGTNNTLARFSVAADGTVSLADSRIAEDGATIRVGTAAAVANLDVTGDISATGDVSGEGCFGPVIVGTTPTTTDGSIGGYTGANARCATPFPGSHVCTVNEIMQSISCSAPDLPATGFAWINNGPPGFTANANDCVGWTSNDSGDLGAYWAFDANGGQGWLQQCNSPARALACCG